MLFNTFINSFYVNRNYVVVLKLIYRLIKINIYISSTFIRISLLLTIFLIKVFDRLYEINNYA